MRFQKWGMFVTEIKTKIKAVSYYELDSRFW